MGAWLSHITVFLSPVVTSNSTWPKGWLNILVFDKNYNLIDLAYEQLNSTYVQPVGDPVKRPHGLLSRNVTIKEPGYVYIYISNEGSVQQDIYFDDMTIAHQKSKVVQANDYYPFGLAFNSYGRESGITNQYQYNGMEMQDELGLGWLDYGARMYMSDIGRWGVVDPLTDLTARWSSYAYAYNNPLRFIDPTGMLNADFRPEESRLTFDDLRYGDNESSKYFNEPRGIRQFRPTDRDDRIGDCSTCPKGKEYDIYRNANHDFAYDKESGIVYNDDGGVTATTPGWGDRTADWVGNNSHELGVTAAAGFNAWAGYQQIKAGIVAIVAPTGATQVDGVYLIADGAARIISTPIQIYGAWTGNTSLENSPHNILGTTGFLMDSGVAGKWTTGGPTQKSLELVGDFGLARYNLVKLATEGFKHPATLKTIAQVGNAGWQIIRPYKDAYKKFSK